MYIVHSTRSGNATATDDQEREGTLRWFQQNPAGVSAHFVGDAAGGLTPVVALDQVAYHAGPHNPYSVGIELTQPRPETPYTDGHYAAAALGFRLVNQWLQARGHPPIPAVLTPEGTATSAGITGHDRTPQGRASGKTDPGARFDFERLLRMAAS